MVLGHNERARQDERNGSRRELSEFELRLEVWEWSGLDVQGEMDQEAERIAERLGERAELIGTKGKGVSEEELEKRLLTEPFKAQWGVGAPMSANSSVPPASKRIDKEVVGRDNLSIVRAE